MIFLKFQEKRYFGASYEGEVFAITGSRFSQRVQSIVAASFSMQEDLGKKRNLLPCRIICIRTCPQLVIEIHNVVSE
ncbi:hypothetical protein B188_02170 [Candidatus Brocadiaceae bacterium B188]|nr:hypothetical protein B188_02170 [Candidatus Brocadiaceae bacterium B188]